MDYSSLTNFKAVQVDGFQVTVGQPLEGGSYVAVFCLLPKDRFKTRQSVEIQAFYIKRLYETKKEDY
jgi:hypothetical protein